MRIFSTQDSEIPALTAIIESILAVIFYWWVAIRFETYLPLLLSAFAAPLVLLRSKQSIALGRNWFLYWEGNADRPRVFPWEDRFLSCGASILGQVSNAIMSSLGRIAVGSVIGYLISWKLLIGIEGWKLFLGSAAIAWISTAIALGFVSLIAAASRKVVFGSRDLVSVGGTAAAEAVGATLGVAAISLVSWNSLIPLGAAAGAIFTVLVTWAIKFALRTPTLVGAFVLAILAVATAIAVWGHWGIFAVLIVGQTVFGSAAGVLLVSIAIRLWATVHYPLKGLREVPRNFRRLWLCMGPLQRPELIPGLLEGESRFATRSFWAEFRKQDTLVGYAISFVLLAIWFGPGWIYRFALKSTLWVWWPLAFIADSPKLAKTPEWQHRAMFGTLIGWIAICTASYTEVFFSITKFASHALREGIPDNPFLTSLGYLFVLNWSVKFWPFFVVAGPTLCLITLLWLDRTFKKYKTAKQYNYEALQREAERTFPVIERMQRVQLLLMVLYCVLVVGQAGLYLNSQNCWVSIQPNVQSWSDWLFGDKSPRSQCGLPPSALG